MLFLTHTASLDMSCRVSFLCSLSIFITSLYCLSCHIRSPHYIPTAQLLSALLCRCSSSQIKTLRHIIELLLGIALPSPSISIHLHCLITFICFFTTNNFALVIDNFVSKPSFSGIVPLSDSV